MEWGTVGLFLPEPGLHITNFTPKGLRKILKALLYTNMTPTKTPIPLKHPNLALEPEADNPVRMYLWKS